MNANDEFRKTGIYLLLLVLQILGAMAFIWQTLPEFRQIAVAEDKIRIERLR
jgi:cell division protein FtsL